MSADSEEAGAPAEKKQKGKKRGQKTVMTFSGNFDIARQGEAMVKAYAAGSTASREEVDTLRAALKEERKHSADLMEQNIALLKKCGQATEMSVLGALLERDKSSQMTPEVILAILAQVKEVGAPLLNIGTSLLRKRFNLLTVGDAAEAGAKGPKAAFVRTVMAIGDSAEALEAIKLSLVKYHKLQGSSDPEACAAGDWSLTVKHAMDVEAEHEGSS